MGVVQVMAADWCDMDRITVRSGGGERRSEDESSR